MGRYTCKVSIYDFNVSGLNRDVFIMPEYPENIINAFKRVDPLLRAIVLVNYESWSDEASFFPKRTSWLNEFLCWGVDA